MLEEELGLPLFVRDGKLLRLTPEGELLRTELARVRRMTEAALYRARQLHSGLSGRLFIGCLSTIQTDTFVVPPTVAFARANPNVEIGMELGSFSVLRSRLESGECDVVFPLSFDLAAYEGVSHMACYRLRPLLVMSREHPLASRDDCTVADFAGETFLLPDTSECFGRGNVLRDILAALGIPDARIGYVRNSESVLLGIRANRGVGLVTSCHCCVSDPKYRVLPLPENPELPTPSVSAVWKKDNGNPVIPSFLQMLERSSCIDVFRN